MIDPLALDVCGGAAVSLSLVENKMKILVKVLLDQGKKKNI